MSDDQTRFITDGPTSRGAQESYRGQVYESEDGSNSADDVDPKKLVNTPTEDDIRWYYRNGPIATTVVDKPVDDAFKHGFNTTDDEKQEFLEEIESSFREAHRKARRDGFALLWFRLRDTANEWQPPQNVNGLHEAKVLTIDDMTTAKPIAFEEKLSAGNVDNFDHETGVSVPEFTTTGINNLTQLAELADDDEPHRLPRTDSGTEIATDRLNDPSIEPGDMRGTLPYGRSRFYDTTDNGIIISNRLDDQRFESPIGYLYSRGASFDPLLIHHSRIFHVTWRGDVDGDSGRQTWGGYEGDSVLRPIVHILRDIHKSNWSLAQNLYRHSTPLHVMSYEEGTSEEDIDNAEEAMRNINAKSSITEPPGFEMRTLDDDSSDTPIEATYDVYFDQICAGTEFTRSVLFGTQAGTVSGSETDIKNYFNKVERLRETRFEDELTDIVNWYASIDANDYSFDSGLDMDWGPLFKLSRLDRAEAMARHVQLVTQASSNYVLTPDEARLLLREQWTDWTDIDIDPQAPIDIEDLRAMDGDLDDEEMDGNPAVGQNGGGRDEESGEQSEI